MLRIALITLATAIDSARGKVPWQEFQSFRPNCRIVASDNSSELGAGLLLRVARSWLDAIGTVPKGLGKECSPLCRPACPDSI